MPKPTKKKRVIIAYVHGAFLKGTAKYLYDELLYLQKKRPNKYYKKVTLTYEV